MVVNGTFNNISGISWRSVLLVDETGVRYPKKTTNLSQVTGESPFMTHNLIRDAIFVSGISESPIINTK